MSAFVRMYMYRFSGFERLLYLIFLWWKNYFPWRYRSINATLFPNCHVSINIFSRRLLNSLTHLENSIFLHLMTPKPSSMNLLYSSGHLMFLFLHRMCSSSSNIAMYILVSMGARFVPIMIPRIWRKNSSWNFFTALFNTKSMSSIMKCAFGMTFWYLKNNIFMIFYWNVGLQALEVYCEQKQFLSKTSFSNVLMTLKLSVRIFSNLE